MTVRVSDWTKEEALAHLRLTFEQACMLNPDVMEPYIVMRVEAYGNAVEEMAVMRQALRDTIGERYKYTLQVAPPLKIVK